ncbi:MAG: hypothetical protein KC933_39930, partial [Myxococcales bacterium]|nr:hypothetical protein [Myxococcales bacterium]
RRAQGLRSLEVWVVMVMGPIPVLAGAHLLAIQVGLLPPETPRITHLMAPVLLLGFGAVILARFFSALAVAEQKQEVLEAEVAARGEALTRTHEALRLRERAAVLSAERERIMREMHDGLGARLVSMLAVLEREAHDTEAMKGEVHGALAEMRLVIDSLDPDIDDLAHLLGSLRVRLKARTDGAGLALRWGVTDLPPLPWLAPGPALDILRIVDEALTNVIKHAAATSVLVRTGTAEGPDGRAGVTVEVVDDGQWRSPAGGGFSRGLSNLRARADGLGGALEVTGGPEGTSVRLWLPLAR